VRTQVLSAVLLGLVGAADQAGAQQQPNPASPPPPPDASGERCTGTLDVHAVDRVSHEPIAGATVSIDGAVELTDASGHSIIGGLCPGDVTVQVERIDYETGVHAVTVGPAKTDLEVELVFKAVQTEAIVIEGTARATDMQATTEVSGEELERTRGESFAGALEEVPGVAALGSGAGVSKPIVRGQFGRRLLLLVDSVRHRAQEWGLDHAPEIDPFAADRLIVVRGAAGVRYGSDAIGGVILVEPPELLREPGLRGEAHMIGFANGRGGSLAARVQGAPESLPGFAWQLEGSGKRLAAPVTPDYALDNTGVFDWNAAGAAGYRLEDADFKLSYRHYQAELGVCSCLRLETSDDFFAQLEREEPLDADLYDSDFGIERPMQRVTHDQLIARGRWLPDGGGTLTATYALQWDHRREFDTVRDSDSDAAQFNFQMWTHDVDAAFKHKPLHVSDRLHLRGVAGATAMGQFHDYAGLPLVPSHDAVAAGVYASERLLGHDFELEAGVRYDHLRRTATLLRRDFLRLVRSDQIAEDACSDSEADPVECDSSFHTVSASLGGLYQFTGELSAKLDLSTASRAPNADEQFLNGTSPTLPVLALGKPDLGPETTYSATATASYRGDRVAAEISGFGNVIDDYVELAPAIDADGMPIFDVTIRGSFPRFVTQPTDALFYGFDGGATVRPLGWLDVAGQLSVVRARDLDDDGFLTFVPPDRARASITARRSAELLGLRELYASVGGTYVARQDRFDLDADLAPPPDAYFLLDAEVGAQTSIGDQILKVAATGSNLLDARYREYTSLMRYFADRPGWQASLRLSLHFDSN
jgi:iron complex outermembrane receptor protein